MLFTGEYEYTIDAKQRLAIPAELRARIDPEEHGSAFYLVPGANGALWLWPERTFEQMVGATEKTLLPGQEVMDFNELMFSQAARLEPDKAGRVRLPDRLLGLIGVEQTVVVLGVKDHLELREPSDWETRRRQALERSPEIMLRAEQALAERRRAGGGS